jgi:tRNA G10  N-methylase Trm11
LKDYKSKYLEFKDIYESQKRPIAVNFREIVDEKFYDRATHLIHSYPAKLIPNIPYFFLNNSYFVNKGDRILDPFSGSGTVMLEGQLSGLKTFGADANPLARLISSVKTNSYDLKLIKTLFNKIESNYIKNDAKQNYPDVVNIDYWFLPHIKKQLNQILNCIEMLESEKYRNFFLLSFSNLVKKVSLADSRISVPVRLNPEKYPIGHQLRTKQQNTLENLKTVQVFEKYKEIVNQNLKRFTYKSEFNPLHNGQVISDDARALDLPNKSVDFILTSPPYAGAQKYIRASSLNLGWTKLGPSSNLKTLDRKNIGRENYKKADYLELNKTGNTDADKLLKKIYSINPLRAHIASNYLIEMTQALKESIRVLKKDKYFVIVAANNNVCGFEFETQRYLKEIAVKYGMQIECELIDDIQSYGLMTKRNKTASIISCEWVLILKKNPNE